MSEPREVIADIQNAQKRAAAATFLEAKREVADYVYPLLESLFEHFNERLEETEAAVSELIDQNGSYIQQDLAAQILSTLEIGNHLAEEVLALLKTAPLDDFTKRKLAEAASAFKPAAEQTIQAVLEISVDEDEDVVEGEADEEEGE